MLRTEGTYEFRQAGITNVSVGELNYGGGIRTSFYSWETASGQAKSASAWYESVGGNSNGISVLSLQPLGWYGEGNRQLNKANFLAQSLGVPLGAIDNGMNCAAKAYHNVSVLTGKLTQPQYVSALTKGGNAIMQVHKFAGRACVALSAGVEFYQMYEYRTNGGRDINVYAKGSLDMAMGIVGLFGPVGFGISMTYFVIDVATDGFNGWGKIQY